MRPLRVFLPTLEPTPVKSRPSAAMGRFENAYDYKTLHPLQYVRHLTQLVAFLLMNGKLLGLAATGIIVPYLHCTQSPFSTVNGAYDSLEYTLARGSFPLLVLGVIYFTAITVGRVFCGWACPMGMVQDFMSYLPFKKERLSPATTNQLKDIKWGILGFSLFSALLVGWRRSASSMEEDPMGVFSDSPFSVFSPSDTLFAYIPWMMMWKVNALATAGLTAWIKMALLVAVLVPSLYIPRFFCRYLCPMGAMLEPMSKYKFLRIYRSTKLPREELNKVLSDVCPTGVQLDNNSAPDFIDHPLCIHCGKCVTELPKELSQSKKALD